MSNNKRVERMQRVGRIHKMQEDRAGRKLALAAQEKDRREQLLEQLLSYQREYRQLFAAQTAEGLDVQKFLNYQQFFAQLDAAVAEQRRALQTGQVEVNESREDWVKKRQATDALSRFAQLLSTERALEEQRQEQRQSDDRNCNLSHKRSK